MHDMHMLLNMMRYDALNIAICRAFRMQVAEALSNSQSLTLSEDKTRVRRSEPLTSAEAALAQIDQRSLYAAPFPHNTRLDVGSFLHSLTP